MLTRPRQAVGWLDLSSERSGSRDWRGGPYEAGLAEAREYVELTGRDALAVAFLGWAHGVAGQRSEAQSALDELRRRAQQEHVDPLAFAWANIGVGDKDAAFEWLERGYEERSSWIIFLKVHPYYEPLRSNPRFTDLLRRTGLEPATHGAQQRSPDARPRLATCSLQHTRGRQRLSLARSRLTRQIANCAAASTTPTRLDATPVAVA
jgi:hypothetical protein